MTKAEHILEMADQMKKRGQNRFDIAREQRFAKNLSPTMDMYKKAREADLERMKAANKEERERLGLEAPPGRSAAMPSPKEMRQLNRQYRREQSPGFGNQARDYGVWSDKPKRS